MPKLPLSLLFVFLLTGLAKAQSPQQLLQQIQKSKPDTSRIRLQLQLGNYYLNKPGELKADLDSSSLFLERALQLSNSLHNSRWINESLEAIAFYDVEAQNIPHAKQCMLQIITYYHQKNNLKSEAIVWSNLGQMLPADNNDNIEYKIMCFKRAGTLFRQAHYPSDEIDMLKNIGDAHLNQGKLDLAEGELLQVIKQYKAIGYKKLHYTYDLLNEVSRQRGDLHKQLYYQLELIKSMNATADTAMAAYFYSKLTDTYYMIGGYKESIFWNAKVLEKNKKANDLPNYYNNLAVTVFSFIAMKQPVKALSFLTEMVKETPPVTDDQKASAYHYYGDIYLNMRKFDKATDNYTKMIDLLEKSLKGASSSNQYITIANYFSNYLAVAKFYFIVRNYDKATHYLQRLTPLPQNLISALDRREINGIQFQVDSAKGNYLSAIKHYEIFKRINDSMFNAAKSKQIAELDVKYKTQERLHSITLLQNKSIVQQVELQKVNTQRNITIGGLAMLFIIAALAFNGYRNKQKGNLLLQQKQLEINQQNTTLQHLVTDKDKLLIEKDWLLKEVHHRVKNNLQIVMSLLSTQSAYLENTAAFNAITESQNRVQAIALLHQKLYSGNNITTINMTAYIADLVNYLTDCFNTQKRHIRFEQMVEPISLDLAQAVPLGLILNEAITNAIKYAFPENGGQIIIALNQIGNDTALLNISDDGIGLSANFDIKKANSLGMEMMKALSAQLGGQFQIKNNYGVAITIEFEIENTFHIKRQGNFARDELA